MLKQLAFPKIANVQTLAPRKNLGVSLGIRYTPKPTPRPNTYIIFGTKPKHVFKSTEQVYKSTVFRKKFFKNFQNKCWSP